MEINLSDFQQLCPECRGRQDQTPDASEVCEFCGGTERVLTMDGDKLMHFVKMWTPKFLGPYIKEEVDKRVRYEMYRNERTNEV